MAKKLNSVQLQELFDLLYKKYLKLPGKAGRKFIDVYICLSCKEINEDSKACPCTKRKISKKKLSTKNKPKSLFPKVIKNKNNNW